MGKVRIGVVAPACAVERTTADTVSALARTLYPDGRAELVFHPQCFERQGHFAGPDSRRAAALIEVANDPTVHAVWFGRGGYGSARILEPVLAGLGPAASAKTYLGYSDMGSLLGALYAKGIGRPAHGPMPADIGRDGGEAAVARALAFLVDGDEAALEPMARGGHPCCAFNLTILSHMLGSAFMPDLAGHVLMLEEVSEHMYRIDRSFCQVTGNAGIREVAGIMLGRCSDIPSNQPDFGQGEEEVARHWCAVSGIPYLGRADIGHDAANKVVPFGT